ncbi:MAG TPA: rRNA maturation RNase YbeY [Bacteroidales bacterium]|nr:rRNA maturation RNase YbeY [Bacteroidales bacterium]
MEILFFNESVDYRPEDEEIIREWLSLVAKDRHFKIGIINYIFTDDKTLLNVNKKFLNHDYLTDIITFDNSQGNEVNGDIYISIDRVKDNASKLSRSFEEELNRVIVHGLLHLTGKKDDTQERKQEMRTAENKYLSLLADL